MPSNSDPPTSNNKGSPDGNDDDFAIDEGVFAFTPRRLRVVCVGAGFSGLIMAYKLKHERPLRFVDFTIYEKNPEVGGTWYENVYPGVGCYIFYFNPNPDWSQCYAKGPEIQQYILDTTERYGLRERVQFRTKVISSIWNEDEGKWDLRLQRGEEVFEDKADVLINGGGVLKYAFLPALIDLLESRDPSYDWTDKRIAVIGNGSSGLQVVPALQPKASKIVNYVRHPAWISTNLAGDITKDHRGTNFAYTEEEKKLYREDPKAFLEYRKYVERSVNSVFKIMLSGSEENKFLFNLVSQVMRERLSENPHLIEKLIPDYEIGCRRLSPGDGYLEAMQADNAQFCFDRIVCITPQGIRTVSESGAESDEEFDLIVCATGFNTSFIPAWTLIGRDGRRLDHEWKDIPAAYFSLCAGGMPNYFVFGGPNAPIGHGSNPLIMAWNADYMLDWIEKIATEDIKSIVVKDSIVHAFNRYARESEALQCIKTIRAEHFDIRYNTSNPFRFLGNGELEMERNGGDTAYYL
ncbi:hypothetical protein BDV11DRAFT_216842 [Aspergillus similis]